MGWSGFHLLVDCNDYISSNITEILLCGFYSWRSHFQIEPTEIGCCITSATELCSLETPMLLHDQAPAATDSSVQGTDNCC